MLGAEPFKGHARVLPYLDDLTPGKGCRWPILFQADFSVASQAGSNTAADVQHGWRILLPQQQCESLSMPDLPNPVHSYLNTLVESTT